MGTEFLWWILPQVIFEPLVQLPLSSSHWRFFSFTSQASLLGREPPYRLSPRDRCQACFVLTMQTCRDFLSKNPLSFEINSGEISFSIWMYFSTSSFTWIFFKLSWAFGLSFFQSLFSLVFSMIRISATFFFQILFKGCLLPTNIIIMSFPHQASSQGFLTILSFFLSFLRDASFVFPSSIELVFLLFFSCFLTSFWSLILWIKLSNVVF